MFCRLAPARNRGLSTATTMHKITSKKNVPSSFFIKALQCGPFLQPRVARPKKKATNFTNSHEKIRLIRGKSFRLRLRTYFAQNFKLCVVSYFYASLTTFGG